VGCVSSPEWRAAGTKWDRGETSYEQFEADKAECEAQSQSKVGECLQGKGYYPWAERSPHDRARDTLPTF